MTEELDLGRWWTVQRGGGPVVATAIHDGHELRPEIAAAMKLGDAERLREEDPFTGQAILDVPTHVIAHRSRFEFDLNRGADEAVYLTEEQCWGLEVWREPPPAALVERSLAIHAAYYAMLGQLLDSIAGEHERFLLIDVHSYNHRRDGPDAAAFRRARERNLPGSHERGRGAIRSGRSAWPAGNFTGRGARTVHAAVPQYLVLPVPTADLPHATSVAGRGRDLPGPGRA